MPENRLKITGYRLKCKKTVEGYRLKVAG